MNPATAFLTWTGVLLAGSFLHAESVAETSLQKLRADRDRAVVAATQPIELRYRAALEQLLRTTMQRGDLEGAIKIKEAITDAAASATRSSPGGPAGLSASLGNATGAKRFAGTKWMRSRIRVEFNADGTYRNIYVGTKLPVGKWRASSPTTVVVTGPNGYSEEFIWNGTDSINYGTHILSPLDPNISLEQHAKSESRPAKPVTSPAPSDGTTPAGPADHFGKPMPPALPAAP